MLEKFKDESGSSLVELVMVMTLFTFMGFTIFVLIQTSAHTQQRIINNKGSQVDARIAMSYINVRLRKNDSTGKIGTSIVEHTGEEGIQLRYRTFEGDYDRWIYYSDGKLLECLTDPDVQPEDSLATVIVEISDFNVLYDEEKNTLTSVIEYEYNDKLENLTSTFKIRNTKSEGIIIL